MIWIIREMKIDFDWNIVLIYGWYIYRNMLSQHSFIWVIITLCYCLYFFLFHYLLLFFFMINIKNNLIFIDICLLYIYISKIPKRSATVSMKRSWNRHIDINIIVHILLLSFIVIIYIVPKIKNNHENKEENNKEMYYDQSLIEDKKKSI